MNYELTTSQKVYLPFKRFFDIVLSALALIVLSPLFLVVAVIIKLDSPGPVFYQLKKRIGKDGRIIAMYKFRSMVKDADAKREALQNLNEMEGPVFKIADDPRITRTGRVLRKLSIDETPQFLNVLLGHMSIVGPRPLADYEVAACTKEQQLKRQCIRPGITCYWQVGGRNKIKSFAQWIELDMMYIEKMGPITDLKLMFKTIPAVLSGRGAR